MKALLALPLFFALGGCFLHAGPTSVKGSECKVFDAPQYAVRGKTPYDQDWVDSTVEGGIGACKWKRPAPRPAELDTPKPARKAVAKPAAAKKQPLWLKMLRAPLVKAPVARAEVQPAPEPPVAEPAAPPPPAPVRRSVIDELLHPDRAR